MAYTIIVGDDNSLYGSCKKKIMQREKLFNKLWFLVAPCYNGFDMSKCTVTMRYLLPISKTFVTETLVLSEDRYENFLKYVLPVDTNLTKEWGDIELNLTFTMIETVGVDADGNDIKVQRVRKTDNHILHITQLPDWDKFIPDSALSALDQRILKQDEQIMELTKLAAVLDGNVNIVDNLVYDDKKETLQLSSNGIGVGDKVSVRDMIDNGIPVVDFNSSSGGNPDVDDDPECEDCDSVVEFDKL